MCMKTKPGQCKLYNKGAFILYDKKGSRWINRQVSDHNKSFNISIYPYMLLNLTWLWMILISFQVLAAAQDVITSVGAVKWFHKEKLNIH